MRKTVKQVAEASGISVRALHHYDEIGLLKPEIGPNGYRYYGRQELLRLQRILFYRELGVALAEIRRMLDDPAFNTRAALVDLRRRVEAEIERRRDLARTIDRTLALIDAGEPLDARRLFDGVSPEKQAAWEAELTQRYGAPAAAAIRQSRGAQAALSPAAMIDFRAEIDAIHARFVALIERGFAPGSDQAQAETARHYRWVSRSWRPDADAYAALGALYIEHNEFRAMYDALHPGLAPFLAEAMAIYARGLADAGRA
ncbi:DNA-binding transcriptional regulator, MerR family [Duganella sp. CF517]|uniref:MerR family transcriptional regulator n=1 Tax=Duganella sp. CF517 TaxID=1881038 RepID=UPI0008ADAA95|nr:MerR family transcriptional regulator [Duganella sp. CF517]SEN32212.1 DNA-binding transcriptional regulator, MerR family [Duganella sp. CF517]